MELTMKTLIMAMFLGLTSTEMYAKSALAEKLSQLDCYEQVTGDLASWQSRGEWKGYAQNSAGFDIYRSPTDLVGRWVELTVSKKRVHSAMLISASDNHKVELDNTCVAKRNSFDRPLDADLMALGLTDEMLAADVASFEGDRGGIVLAWSPHMPWSLEMFDFVKTVAKKENLKLTVTLDPHADPEYAREFAEKHGLEGEDIFRPIQSLELIFRGMTTHYPSVLRYGKNGFSRLLPGREITSALESYTKTEGERLKSQIAPELPKQANWNLYLIILTLCGLVLAAMYLNHKKQGTFS